MASAQETARRQQRAEELCAAAIRALTGDPQLHYRARRLHRGVRPLPVYAPHLRTDPETDDFAAYRGAVDGIALRLLHSDAELHRQLSPADPVERLVFELLEQLRVETMVPPDMPGMAQNLRRRFEQWSHAFHSSRLTEGRVGLVLYTLAQMCWSRLHARPVLAETEDYIEGTRAKLIRALGANLAAIRRERNDQAAYARPALEIAGIVARMVRNIIEQQPEGDEGRDDDENARDAFSLLLDFESEESDTIAAATTGRSSVFEEAERAYRVYTTRYDREVAAGSLVRKELLREYRERLDKRIAGLGINLTRLSRQLSALLAVPQRDGWLFGQEEGQIDGRRLAQLVSSPAERRLFVLEQYKPDANCIVSFLIDCSGSMKEHIESIAVVVDLLVRALERCGVTTEVLGFTTNAWNGGRAGRDWTKHGQPRNPGRLNEVCYMVFKDGERNWRRARTDLAALLKADLFREGIDGEAVEWACGRMLARDEERRILIVISDGCPMDTATNLANDTFYLDNHLKDVVARHEQLRDVEIMAIGVGLDLTPYYRRSLATDLSRAVDNDLFFEIVQLIGGRRRR